MRDIAFGDTAPKACIVHHLRCWFADLPRAVHPLRGWFAEQTRASPSVMQAERGKPKVMQALARQALARHEASDTSPSMIDHLFRGNRSVRQERYLMH